LHLKIHHLENNAVHTTKALLQEIAKGNTAAFAQLYMAFYDKVYSVALHYLKVHELAEDSTQQVFMKLWERYSTLALVDDIDAFVFITARNEIFNHLRKNSMQATYRELIRELFLQETGSPEDILIRKQKARLIERVIDRLPERQRQAFRLSREKGLRYKEIAGIMNISVPTVKEHISNAMHQIKSSLFVHKDELLLLLLYCVYNQALSSLPDVF
jgi:RNA polymerase sigma-70 factor, Bacteroides expansion family 1